MYLSKCHPAKEAYYLSELGNDGQYFLSTSLLQRKENPSSYVTITASVPAFHLTPKDLIFIFMKLFVSR